MSGIGSRTDDYGNWVIDTYESCKVTPPRSRSYDLRFITESLKPWPSPPTLRISLEQGWSPACEICYLRQASARNTANLALPGRMCVLQFGASTNRYGLNCNFSADGVCCPIILFRFYFEISHTLYY